MDVGVSVVPLPLAALALATPALAQPEERPGAAAVLRDESAEPADEHRLPLEMRLAQNGAVDPVPLFPVGTGEIVAKSAAEMSPKLQEVILGLLRGETPEETAERLKLNPVTVRTRLVRARAILRRELRPYIDVGEVELEKDIQLTA